jgi:hypothetical protein
VQLKQDWRGHSQNWRVFFQIRVDESAVEKIPDSTSLRAAMPIHLNSEDALSIDPNLPHDVLEWIIRDPIKAQVTGLIFVPSPYRHPPWHACQQVWPLPQSSAAVKIAFIKSSLPADAAKGQLQELITEYAKQFGLGNVKVTALVAEADQPKPHAFVIFFSDLAAREFVSLESTRTALGPDGRWVTERRRQRSVK